MFGQILKSAVPLAAVIFFALGITLEQILLPINAQARGASPAFIGMLSSIHFAGILLGSLATRSLINQLGSRLSFIAAASMATTTLVSYPYGVDLVFWPVLTFLTGVSYAVLVIGSEAWVCSCAHPQFRAGLLAIYMLLYDATDVLSSALSAIHDPLSPSLFAFAGIMLVLAACLIILSGGDAGATDEDDPLTLRDLWFLSPIAITGAMLCGAADATYLSLLPTFAIGQGAPPQTAAWMLAGASLAAAFTQYPFSWWSDRGGREAPVLVTGIVAAASLALIAGGIVYFGFGLIPAVILYAAVLSPIYALIGVGAYDRADATRYAGIAGGMLLCYSIGGIIGPFITGAMLELSGPGAAFGLLAFAHLAVLYHIRARRSGKGDKVPE